MKGKSPLVMIEQMVMVLVFAIAATLCVKMFVLSGELANKYEATDRAVLEAQNMAENCKAYGMEQSMSEGGALQTGVGKWTFFYDANWDAAEEENAKYYMEICVAEESEWFWKGDIVVSAVNGAELFWMPVAGQKQAEVAEYEEK